MFIAEQGSRKKEEDLFAATQMLPPLSLAPPLPRPSAPLLPDSEIYRYPLG